MMVDANLAEFVDDNGNAPANPVKTVTGTLSSFVSAIDLKSFHNCSVKVTHTWAEST
jgi:hypothetical protein